MGNLQVFLVSSLPLLVFATALVHAVDYQVKNEAPSTPGGIIFTSQIGNNYSRQTLESATNFIWNLLQETDPANRQDIQQVTLILVASISSPDILTVKGNTIRFSSEYLAGYPAGGVKREFTGIIYHAMTCLWLWNGDGRAEVGLVSGIADFVRLKAGLGIASWAQPGEGDMWDQGYDVTARFLDYCESLMNGFVARLSAKMRYGYSDSFFSDLLGESVDQLWSDYKAGHKFLGALCYE